MIHNAMKSPKDYYTFTNKLKKRAEDSYHPI